MKDSLLTQIRILDLTEGGCMLGGRLLGDAGADVIKIERPGGSDPCISRIWPYYQDSGDPQKSLFWFTYNANKRGITLNLEKPEGGSFSRNSLKKPILSWNPPSPAT